MTTLAVTLLTALYLVLLWVTSSVLRGKGLILAVLGLLVLWLALSEFGRGRRAFFYRLFFLMTLCAATVLACEGVLYLYPGLPKGRLANYAANGYHGEPGGIYVRDAHLGHAMRPNFQRRMYWNGHIWRHETNADGYRGPRLTKADAVVLGDSMIYGHGIETDQTVPARFGAITGLATANLGQQGICSIQSLELLRRKGLGLSPRLILVCPHFTDPADALETYAPEELSHFLAQEGYRPLAREVFRTPPPLSVFAWWNLHAALPLRTGRALQGIIAEPRDRAMELPVPTGGPGDRFVPPAEALATPFDPQSPKAAPEQRLGWQANKRALAEIQREARQIGAKLILFDLGYPTAFSAAVEQVARDIGATYCDVGRHVLARAQAGERMYLAHDGHWTPEGADAIARGLAQTAGH
jgi:hypothetical protein